MSCQLTRTFSSETSSNYTLYNIEDVISAHNVEILTRNDYSKNLPGHGIAKNFADVLIIAQPGSKVHDLIEAYCGARSNDVEEAIIRFRNAGAVVQWNVETIYEQGAHHRTTEEIDEMMLEHVYQALQRYKEDMRRKHADSSSDTVSASIISSRPAKPRRGHLRLMPRNTFQPKVHQRKKGQGQVSRSKRRRQRRKRPKEEVTKEEEERGYSLQPMLEQILLRLQHRHLEQIRCCSQKLPEDETYHGITRLWHASRTIEKRDGCQQRRR